MQFGQIVRAAGVLVVLVTASVTGQPGIAEAAPITTHPVLQSAATDLAKRHNLRIVAFGSSSTEGVGASSPANNYPSRLAAELVAALPANASVEVLNRGVGGEDAEDMMRRLPAVLAERPDLVIWQTGTNDLLRSLPLPRFVALTRAGIAAIRAAGSDVMLMEPQDCPGFSGKAGALAYRDAVRDVGGEMGVPVIRRFDLMQGWRAKDLLTPAQMHAADGLHMTDAGYALLAKAVARAILADVTTPPVVKVAAAPTP